MLEAFKTISASPTQRLVAYMLADSHNGETGRCDPSIARLMVVTSLSNRAVIDAILALEKSGHLTVSRVFGTRSKYELHPKTSEPCSLVNGSIPVSEVHRLQAKPVSHVHTCATFTSEPASLPPVNVAPKPVNVAHTNRKNRKLTGNTDTPKPKSEGKAAILSRDAELANLEPLPLLLATHPPFATDAWPRWCEWRTKAIKLKGWPWTRNAARRALSACERFGADKAVAAIEHSIDRWQDIYDPEEKTAAPVNGSSHHHQRQKDYSSWKKP